MAVKNHESDCSKIVFTIKSIDRKNFKKNCKIVKVQRYFKHDTKKMRHNLVG